MTAVLGFVETAALYGLASILVRPKRGIGSFVMDVVIEEIHHDELEITDHPVEQGSVISDHAYKRPAEVVIRGGWSNSPKVGFASGIGGTLKGVQSLVTGNLVNQVRDIYAKLLKLQAERTLIDVYTGKRVYNNMLIRSLVAVTDKQNENSLFLTATLRQLIVVQTQVVTISAPMNQQTNPQATAPTVNRGQNNAVPTTRFRGPH